MLNNKLMQKIMITDKSSTKYIMPSRSQIHLKPGFTAPSGIEFTAQIGTVSNIPKRFYYLKDHLGSIRAVVNETGELVGSDGSSKVNNSKKQKKKKHKKKKDKKE